MSDIFDGRKYSAATTEGHPVLKKCSHCLKTIDCILHKDTAAHKVTFRACKGIDLDAYAKLYRGNNPKSVDLVLGLSRMGKCECMLLVESKINVQEFPHQRESELKDKFSSSKDLLGPDKQVMDTYIVLYSEKQKHQVERNLYRSKEAAKINKLAFLSYTPHMLFQELFETP